jgi:hypothetical protein
MNFETPSLHLHKLQYVFQIQKVELTTMLVLLSVTSVGDPG